jgi:magnesium-transporting ATPase (P-type)
VPPEESTNAEGGAVSAEDSNALGEVNLNSRLSYIPVPVAHVLRDCKRFLVDSKDIIVGDVVILDSKVSGIIPADIILFETSESEEFVISNYSESFDP